MNIIAIPFHDWRKSKKEGFRTRDCHLINALQKDEKVKNILVINRPTTLLELFYKKRELKFFLTKFYKIKFYCLVKYNSFLKIH